MLRTQIYLPEDLREKIDKERARSGESLADYLRKAAEERVEKSQNRKEDLKKLAKEIFKPVKKSGWENVDAVKWQREIRRDRKILK